MQKYGPEFYDQIYASVTKRPLYFDQAIGHIQRMAYFCRGPVLDLACGLGQLANEIKGPYTGIDFSTFALEIARLRNTNPEAVFLNLDIMDLSKWVRAELIGSYDTVVLSEILEHVEDPRGLFDFAKKLAKKRIVIGLPIDMPMEGHIKGTWSQSEIENLFGLAPAVIEQGCPTPKGKKLHWHVVYELGSK